MSFGNDFLRGTQATSIKFPPLPKLTTIGIWFLTRTEVLKSIEFPLLPELTSIKKGFLFNARSLKSITFPALLQLTTIGDEFLLDAYSLESITYKGPDDRQKDFIYAHLSSQQKKVFN